MPVNTEYERNEREERVRPGRSKKKRRAAPRGSVCSQCGEVAPIVRGTGICVQCTIWPPRNEPEGDEESE